MYQLTLNFNQGFELAALLPCLLVVFYLAGRARRNFSSSLIPMLYFLSLGSGFLLPLYDSLPDFWGKKTSSLLLGFAESSLPEMSFLLIMQFVRRKISDFKYFLILAVPLIGGAPFTYLKFEYSQVCVASCLSTLNLFIIYKVVTAAFVFLLLLVSIGRSGAFQKNSKANEQSRYWLIICLFLFNLASLGVDLAIIYKGENPALLFTHTMIGVTFIYLVLCSIFQVFNKSFDIEEPINISLWIPSDRDHKLVEKVENLLRDEKIYRQVGFSRRDLAAKLDTNETTLSRAINWKFKKSFRELLNQYRIEEAKKLLLETAKPITVISFESGFKSITSFNRVFKETTGMSATEFKNRNAEVGDNKVEIIPVPTPVESAVSNEIPQNLKAVVL